MKQEQDLAAKIAAQTAKKTAKVESAAAKKIAAAEKAAQKKTAAAERKMLRRAQKAEKQAEKIKAKVAKTEKKAADRIAKAEMRAAKKSEHAANVAASQGGAEAAESGGKKKKLLLLLLPVVVIVAAGAFFFLRGRNAEEPEVVLEPISVPLSYSFGEESSVAALPVIGEDVVVYSEPVPPAPAEPSKDEANAEGEGTEGEESTEDGEEAKEEEEEEAPEPTATRFRYENVQDPKGLMSAYAALLTQKDAGFSAVNEELQRMDLPDFEGKAASEGQEAVPAATSVHLARNGDGSDDLVYSIQLDWDESVCTVVVDTPKGRVRNPPSESNNGPMSTGLTVEGFQQLAPSALGLPGASMDEYRIYVEDGMLLVYGNTCVRLNVYSQNSSTGTNEVAGRFFLSSDGQHLYRYDVANNAVVELEIPK